MELSGIDLIAVKIESYPRMFAILIFVLLISLEILARQYLSIREDLSERDKYINRLMGKIYLKHEPMELDFKRKQKINFKLQLSSEKEIIKPFIIFKDCKGFSISISHKKNHQITLNKTEDDTWMLYNIISGKKITLYFILEKDNSIKNIEREITISVISDETRGKQTTVKCCF